MSPKELRSRRLSLGMTIPQLAHELGLTTSELQQMEQGQMPLPARAQLSIALSALETRMRAVDCLVVEDDDAIRQLFVSRLRAEGCTEVQGYVFSPPQPAREVEKILRQFKGKSRAVG